MIFGDISKFNNINDYLPILNGCILVDLIVILLTFNNIINSKYLKKWYINFNLSAVIADVLILVIGIIIARFSYNIFFNKFNILYFTILAVFIQIIHDILFYIVFTSIPIGNNYMLDFFKLYAKEVSVGAILGDSAMMVGACLFSSYFSTISINSNIIYLIFFTYVIPYLIYYQSA
jgi:uncharacterized protein YacL